ncbi:hypothetical protein OPV22_004306 [Ensete ventricosum]|uniref:NAD(P)-binding domain-containing protein n=1 Tax=Ensete ventricosum TaxID=4639 RepID=A0AAV8S316_ENSVE|nr:hypothetical protein OPV22_004306 [Ensete ventricosum]
MATTLHGSLPFRLPLPLKSSLTPALIPRNYFSSFAMAANATSSVGGNAERIEVEADVKVEDNNNDKKKKKIFVAGSTGRTGKRIVERLLSGGYSVRAGALDLEKARSGLPQDPDLQIVRADVTEGSEKLAEAIGDAEAVICSTGFRYSWDIFAPWKVDNFGTVNLVEACRKTGVNRPGGLRDQPATGNIIMEPEDTLYEGSISRDQVAEVAVGSLFCPDAFYKVVEIVSRSEAPKRPVSDLFAAVRQS